MATDSSPAPVAPSKPAMATDTNATDKMSPEINPDAKTPSIDDAKTPQDTDDAKAPTDDSIEARISSTCPEPIRLLLLTAWGRDLSGVKPLLDEPGRASAQDPSTGETPLHAVIRGCGAKTTNTNNGEEEGDDDEEMEAAEIVRELFCWGAIWNDVDANNETPGCVALRLGRRALYDLCVEAGVRAELLFGLMGGYEELESGDEEMELDGWGGEDEVQEDEEEGEVPTLVDAAVVNVPDVPEETKDTPEDPDISSKRYLESSLTLTSNKLVDADLNGVMMAWETPIMQRTIDALLGSPPAQGKRILNVGFGMGIVDGMFAAASPVVHHIIEAHPDVLTRLASSADSKDTALFGKAWEASGPSEGAFKVHPGRWQDVVPELISSGNVYDVIYFDTFGEDYTQLRNFFTEHIPALLDTSPGTAFGYFNGCGADRRICYDVYARVAEAHLAEAGMDVEWVDVDVDGGVTGAKEGEGEWEGVRRRYWTLEKYRLPVCTWMG